LLDYAELAIAMEDAPDRLKQAATWIAPSNDEDGVAWALKRILRNQFGNN
jgi:hydroxymethylpyrimidine pyrophosphatase-like HAD family hydrolase